jgi:hypothetical protein
MKVIQIVPYTSAGPIRLGMTMEEVRKTLGTPFTSFQRDAEAKIPSDAFDSEGIYIYYKEPGVVEAVELAPPARAILKNTEPLGKPYSEISSFIKSLDPSAEEDEAGLTSFELGVGLYAPSAQKEPQLPVESVIVFEKGYYSEFP